MRTAVSAERDLLSADDRSLSLLVNLDFFRQYNRYEKIMCIDIDIDYLSSAFDSSNLFSNIILADSQGWVISAAHGYSTRPYGTFSVQAEIENGMLVME